MSKITLTAREILKKKIDEYIEKYPTALKPKHIKEIMDCTQTQTYNALNNKKIPGAKNIKGLGWRIPRETFLAWWFGNKIEEEDDDVIDLAL